MKLFAVGVLLWAAVLPAQDLPQWVLTLSKLKRQARAEFERLPNYLCLETVERYHVKAGARSFVLQDTLHLQVAVVNGEEMMAEALSGRLESFNPDRFSASGVLGTGAFSALGRNLFIHDNGLTTGWGEEELDGRDVVRYDFEIPENRSGYVLSSPTGRATVGERGSYWVDAKSLELLRIEARATDIPFVMGIMDVLSRIDYQRVRLGLSDVLLPRNAETLIRDFDGSQKRNIMVFSGCREYKSESTIRFDTVK